MLKKIIELLCILVLAVSCECLPTETVSFEKAYDTSEMHHLEYPGLR